MAGIGEASAIIAVASLGISLSKTLIEFVGEVKDARSRIERIGNEVLTTSERLKEIGNLIERNKQTRIFSEEGISSAKRCSTDCQQIIDELKTLLLKGGSELRSETFEINASIFSAIRWPWIRAKLEVPRAELQKVKIDLTLLFSSFMAVGAASAVEKAEYCKKIPTLKRDRQAAVEAIRRAERAKKIVLGRLREQGSGKMNYESDSTDEDTELWEKFVEYQEQRTEEVENKKAQGRAALLQAEEDRQKRIEDEKQQEIERKAVEEYVRKRDERTQREVQRKKNFQDALTRLGFEEDKIKLITESPDFRFEGEDEDTHASVPEIRPNLAPQEDSSGGAVTNTQANVDSSSNRRFSRRKFLWWRSEKAVPKIQRTQLNEPAVESRISGTEYAGERQLEIETWIIDVSSLQSTKVSLPHDLMVYLSSAAKHQDAWYHFARLQPLWRNAVLWFLDSRNQDEEIERQWTLRFLRVPKGSRRKSLLGENFKEPIVQLIVSRAYLDGSNGALPDESELLDSTPVQIGSLFSRLPANNLPTIQKRNGKFGIASVHDNRSLKYKTGKSSWKGGNPFRNAQRVQSHVLYDETSHKNGSEDKIKQKITADASAMHPNSPSVYSSGDYTSTVVVEFDDDEPHKYPGKGTTYVPLDVASTRAIRKLGYFFKVQRRSSQMTGEICAMIPWPLTVLQINELSELTRQMMNEGGVPRRPLPVIKVRETSKRAMDNVIASQGLVDGESRALRPDAKIKSTARELSRPFDTYSRYDGAVQSSSEEETFTSPYRKDRSRARRLPFSYTSESKKNLGAGDDFDWPPPPPPERIEKKFQELRFNRRGRNDRAHEQDRGRKRTVTWERERRPSLERDTQVNGKEGAQYVHRIDSETEIGPEYTRQIPIILPPDENVNSQDRRSSHVRNGTVTFNNEQSIEEARIASRGRTPSLPHSSSSDGSRYPEIISGTRTQGDDDGTSHIKGKRSSVAQEKGYRGDDWPLMRQPQFMQAQSGGYNSSDDDNSFHPNEPGGGHEKARLEAGLSDKETTIQTLKRYTTFQGDDLSTTAIANDGNDSTKADTTAIANDGNDSTKADASSTNLPLPQPLALDPALYDVASYLSPLALDPALYDVISYHSPAALDPALYNVASNPSSRGAIPQAHMDTQSPGSPAGDDSDTDQSLESSNTNTLPANAWDGTKYLTYGAEASNTERIDWEGSHLYC